MAAPRAYNDPDYRQAAAELKRTPTPCWFPGCTARADTIDHDPPLKAHTHRRGTHCCQLKPACKHHNCSHGAKLGNAARRPRSGWA